MPEAANYVPVWLWSIPVRKAGRAGSCQKTMRKTKNEPSQVLHPTLSLGNLLRRFAWKSGNFNLNPGSDF